MAELTQEEKDRLKSFETLADEIVDRMMGKKPESSVKFDGDGHKT